MHSYRKIIILVLMSAIFSVHISQSEASGVRDI